jgi:hypothetical protein
LVPSNQNRPTKRGTQDAKLTICEGGELPYPMSFEVENQKARALKKINNLAKKLGL